MRHGKKLTVLVGTLIVCFLFSGSFFINEGKCADKPSKAKLRMVGTLPLDHYFTTALKDFKKNAETRSNGTLTVDIFPASQLYNDRDLVKVMPKGAVDMGVGQSDMWTGLIPILGVLNLYNYYDSLEHLVTLARYLKPTISKEYEKKANLKLLGYVFYDAPTISSRKAIRKLEDFRGVKLRAGGEYQGVFMQSVGASPILMSSGEVYDAIQKGTIDGCFSGSTSQLARKFYEVTHYLISSPSMFIPTVVYETLINCDSWNKLSPELQKNLQEASDKMETQTMDLLAKETNSAHNIMSSKGLKIADFSSEEKERVKAVVRPAVAKKFTERTGADHAAPLLKKLDELREQK
ncbi:MAG: TRAP transporter substrate-binding protein DctP [Desulforhabdus sp.]|jgi:C4-dicarboxylate-binding protein DctP|nr:TRAP transporter substrate-binding protein DctP [Desulforhabdus sp.]